MPAGTVTKGHHKYTLVARPRKIFREFFASFRRNLCNMWFFGAAEMLDIGLHDHLITKTDHQNIYSRS